MKNFNRISADFCNAHYAAELHRLREILKGAQFAMLFGSLTSAAPKADSDVDLAVMYSVPLCAESLIRLTGEVAAVFNRDADLLDLRRAGPIVKMQVLRHGHPVVINDPSAFEDFRMYTPIEYFDFKISRRPIEETIKVGSFL